MIQEPTAATEMLKAMGDPIRWNILHQIAEQDELAASTLETTLPVSKPTISYHMKILSQAGLIDVIKRGRNYYYRVRQAALADLMDEVRVLMPTGPRLVGEPAKTREPHPRTTPAPLRKAVGDDVVRGDDPTDPSPPPTLLTW